LATDWNASHQVNGLGQIARQNGTKQQAAQQGRENGISGIGPDHPGTSRPAWWPAGASFRRTGGSSTSR
jgi:hypothetical protein